MSDIAKLQRLASVAKPGSTLSSVLNEVAALVPRVGSWNIVPTSGSAVCFYDTSTGKPSRYEVKYQQGNIGNLVHELIHVAVNEAYEQDFVNYPNRNPAKPPPPRAYDGMGRCTNEFDRQTAFMTSTGNAAASDTLSALAGRATGAIELTPQQRTDIVTKLNYGLQWPHKEYDTVITQVLVWLFEWGYPIANVAPTARKPMVNALYEDVERAVGQAYQQRKAG